MEASSRWKQRTEGATPRGSIKRVLADSGSLPVSTEIINSSSSIAT